LIMCEKNHLSSRGPEAFKKKRLHRMKVIQIESTWLGFRGQTGRKIYSKPDHRNEREEGWKGSKAKLFPTSYNGYSSCGNASKTTEHGRAHKEKNLTPRVGEKKTLRTLTGQHRGQK